MLVADSVFNASARFLRSPMVSVLSPFFAFSLGVLAVMVVMRFMSAIFFVPMPVCAAG